MIPDFTLSRDDLEEIGRKMTNAFEKGLVDEGDNVPIKMFCTHVYSLPNGSEKGDFLTLDLGGSNFRVLLISKSHDVFQC